MSYPLFTPLSNTLVEHKIKIEVAPELKLPPLGLYVVGDVASRSEFHMF